MSSHHIDGKGILKVTITAFVLAMIIRTFVFAPILIQGDSMKPTLENNDRVVLNRLSTFQSPDRFDIVVFHAPNENKDYVKRIIGLSGEKIEYKDDVLYIDNHPVEEPYLQKGKKLLQSGEFTYDFTLEEVIGRATVPEGEVFVMGDNRRYSKDSRTIGTIPLEDIVGEATVIYWPFSHFKKLE